MPATIHYQLQLAKQALSSASVIDDVSLEAQILLAHVLSVPRSYLYAWPHKTLLEDELNLFTQLIEERRQGKPIAYIVAKKAFWKWDLMVNEDVLIPRPETEILIEKILSLYDHSPIKVADLGTGSGAIALSLAHERPFWEIVATDASQNALKVARYNAQHLGLNQITFCQGDWCQALNTQDFDVIVSNPPYIAQHEYDSSVQTLAYEPTQALIGGENGYDAIASIIQSARLYLKPDGMLLIEHGFSQGEAVALLFKQAGYSFCTSIQDLAGLARITLAKWVSKN